MNYSRVEKYRNQKSKKFKKGLATALMGTVLVSPIALPSRTAEQVEANAMVNQGIMPNATASSIATPAGHATADKASDKAGNQAAKNDGSSAKADNKSGNKADNKTNDTHATANGSSQAANHGSHASSATSSSVNGGKHDQAAASSSAQPATSNSQASSSKPASSTANKPADKPATSGSQASSSQTSSSSQSTPAQGSSSTTPSQNGSSTAPSQGSSSQTPSQGSSSTTPSQSGNTTTPSQGSSSTAPSQGSSSQTPDYNNGVVNADGTTNYQAAMNQQGPWDGQSTSTDDFGRSQAEQTWKENHPGAQMTGQTYPDGSTSQTPVYSGQDDMENAARPQMSQQQLDDTNAAMQKNVDASQTFGNGIQWVSSDYQGEVAGTQKITVDNPVNTPYENYTDHAGQIDANVVKQAYSGTSPYGVTATIPDGAHYVSSTITNAGQTGGADGLSANNVNLTFYK